MEKPALKQEMHLITQGDITTAQGEVPVIDWEVFSCHLFSSELLAHCVNFLRSGCPAVQILGCQPNETNWQSFIAKLDEHLELIALENEKFEYEAFASQSVSKVIVLTRRTENAAE